MKYGDAASVDEQEKCVVQTPEVQLGAVVIVATFVARI